MSQTSFEGNPVAQIVVGLLFLGASTLVSGFVVVRLQSKATGVMQTMTLLVMFTTLLNAWATFSVLFGAGTDHSRARCEALVVGDSVTYALAKAANHGFLAERLHIVYFNNKRRHLSPAYWMFSAVVGIIIALAAYVVHSRTAELHADGHCYVGYGFIPPILVLSLSIILDLGLSIAFILPVYRAGFLGARKLAARSLLATGGMLLSVVGEYAYIIILGDKARGWVLSLITLTDLTFNATVLFITTQRTNPDAPTASATYQVSRSKVSQSNARRPPTQEWNPTASHATAAFGARSMADVRQAFEAGLKDIPLELHEWDEEEGDEVFDVKILNGRGGKPELEENRKSWKSKSKSRINLGEVVVSQTQEVEIER